MGSLCRHQQGDPIDNTMKKKQQSVIETLAAEFRQLDDERHQLERKCRSLKKRLSAIQNNLQEFVGTADVLEVPIVSRIGNFLITQIKKHRQVDSYEYDYLEFKVIDMEEAKSPDG